MHSSRASRAQARCAMAANCGGRSGRHRPIRRSSCVSATHAHAVDDTIAIATLFRCLVSAYVRRPELGVKRSTATRRLIEENRWRAQRHGIEARFIDEFGDREVSVPELVAEAMELIAPDARALDPDGALGTLSTILARGTSAHAQLACYDARRSAGTDRVQALRAVVDMAHPDDLPAADPSRRNVASAIYRDGRRIVYFNMMTNRPR